MSDANAPETPQPQAPADGAAESKQAASSPSAAPAVPSAGPAAPPPKLATPPAAAPKPPGSPAATTPKADAAPGASAPTASAPAVSAATAVAEPEAPKAPKIKAKKATQRSCDEKDAKGKLCCGHLKRWYDYPKEIEALVGKKAEIYRCEFCQAIYKPDLSKTPHSYTLRY